MSLHILGSLSLVVVILAASVTLLGTFTGVPLLRSLAQDFMASAVILAGAAMLIAVVNLFKYQWAKVANSRKGAFSGFVFISAFTLTAVVAGVFGLNQPASQWIFTNIQLPVEISLLAVLAVVLVTSAANLVRRRFTLFHLVFLVTAVIMLVGTAPMLGIEIPFIHGTVGLKSLLAGIPAVAGVRGLLIGVALGSVAAGLRVLLGVDKPYGG